MKSLLDRISLLKDEIIEFPLHNCTPSDDSDKESAYLAGFRDLIIRFKGSISRVADDEIKKAVEYSGKYQTTILLNISRNM